MSVSNLHANLADQFNFPASQQGNLYVRLFCFSRLSINRVCWEGIKCMQKHNRICLIRRTGHRRCGNKLQIDKCTSTIYTKQNNHLINPKRRFTCTSKPSMKKQHAHNTKVHVRLEVVRQFNNRQFNFFPHRMLILRKQHIGSKNPQEKQTVDQLSPEPFQFINVSFIL